MSELKRKYNRKPDRLDRRDFPYRAKLKKLPAKVDSRNLCSMIEDQSSLGSCTGNAWAGADEFCQIRDGKSRYEASRLFIYYNERVIEGTVNSDSGASIRDGAKTLTNTGVCEEKYYPYMIKNFKTKPSQTAYSNAAMHKHKQYQKITDGDLNGLKDAIARKLPVVIGFTVFESFESNKVAQTGIMPMPKKSESVLGGHAVVFVGYDDSKQWFIVRNSWGAGWGDKGYFYMPYAYVQNKNWVNDLWALIS